MCIEVVFVSCSFIIFWTTSHEKKNKNTFFGAYTSIPRKSIIQMLIFIEYWAVYSFSKCTRPVDTILSAGSLFGFFLGEFWPVWTKRNLLVVCFEPVKKNFHWNETKKEVNKTGQYSVRFTKYYFGLPRPKYGFKGSSGKFASKFANPPEENLTIECSGW